MEFSDGCPIHVYASTSRDSLLAAIRDVIQAEGQYPVPLLPRLTMPGHRIDPPCGRVYLQMQLHNVMGLSIAIGPKGGLGQQGDSVSRQLVLTRDFDPVKYILEHIQSGESDTVYFEKKATLRLAQLDKIAECLARNVVEHHEELGIRHIASSMHEFSRELVVHLHSKKKQALLFCSLLFCFAQHNNLKSLIVGVVIDAYVLVGDINDLAEKILSFFMQEVLSETYSLLKDIVIEEYCFNVPKVHFYLTSLSHPH
ncbi:hypothetical protein KFK09_011559 [Dendrobium nobile]|uniref:Uncharacterized protein n=1 Tax=Dendrobium nobile TaxID=94219 RepID=A0A8T3BII9_DENNO|nr:hypothetical protein KFK09_011559 [Dendrobium nobile]